MLKRKRWCAQTQLRLFEQAVPFTGHSAKADESGSLAATDQRDSSALWPTVQRVDGAALWLCVYLPLLPLEVSAAAERGSNALPLAVVSKQGTRLTVLVCNAAAEAAGVCAGMALNAARALCPALDIRQRDEQAETDYLNVLAEWALRYTPVVSIDAQGALLLDIAASLRLFKGLEALRQDVLHGLAARGHATLLACAPTAAAALWLVRAGRQSACIQQSELRSMLASLPLACLGWPATVHKKLQQMGLATLGDCMRLPRAGFARRIGMEYLQELDEGFAYRPQLLAHYAAPESFTTSLDLEGETLATVELIEAVDELLTRLAAFLRQRQLGVQKVQLLLQHCQREATVVPLELRDASGDTRYLLELLQLQLDQLILPAPVNGLSLEADRFSSGAYSSAALPGIKGEADAQPANRWLIQLVERLQARLGVVSVYGLGVVAEHRPERAWRVAELPASYEVSSAQAWQRYQPRPCWLLQQPRRISGAAERVAETHEQACVAERIETGWWDEGDIRRDYYAIRSPQGSRWWVYRDCRSSAWYLHGIFG